MKQNRGAALTGVILMVLVMTLIGVPLLGMVVYNYRLRELDNSIKRAEYENEMSMDKVSIIIRNTVMDAINEAKATAANKVNENAEIQKSNYSSLYNQYTDIWVNAYALWQSGDKSDEVIAVVGSEGNISKEEYVTMQVENELNSGDVGSVLDEYTGQIDQSALNTAYNIAFARLYQDYITSNISPNIQQVDEYRDIVDVSVPIYVGNDNVSGLGTYLKIIAPTFDNSIYDVTGLWLDNKLNVNVSTSFKKSKNTPSISLSATFIISTPAFDAVSSVTQESIVLSNALLNQGGIVSGKKISIGEGATLYTGADITAMGSSTETSIELRKNSKLIALNDSKARIATEKDILLRGGSTLTTGQNPIYYRNLYVGPANFDGSIDSADPITINFIGDAVAEDDLEVNHEGTVSITQSNDAGVKVANYYGFNDTNNKGPDSSSSIVVNSNAINNKVLSLGNLYLAGRAFIDGVKGTRMIEIGENEGVKEYADRTYKTGESIAIKGNYLAYQSPLSDNDANYNYLSYKLLFSTYFMERKTDDERKNAAIKLVDSFNSEFEPPDFDSLSATDKIDKFDVEHKWRYFVEYAKKYSTIVKKLNINSNPIYIEGAGFNGGDVINSSNADGIKDTSFKDNIAIEYEKYTKYFGYRPISDDATKKVDMTKAKIDMIGEDGWIKPFTDSLKEEIIEDGKYYQIYKNGDVNLTLSGNVNKGIIVCTGNVNITVPTSATFSGVIFAEGNISISGGELTFTDSKEEVINTVIGNYMGNNSSLTGENSTLFNSFAYDNSGTTYVVTSIGDNFIDINDLIGITNWKKSRYGRL